ncbi:hypothetical protein [Kocuria aegyptia]|uniref:Uncharacterized protein n=1 Tax=Kocuria aegyptia TaxID=330943 RepID=A0ABN2KP30_9MICC
MPAEDAQTQAAALAELLEDDARRALYGDAGRRRCLRDFTLERMVARTRAVYDLTLEAHA